MSKGLEAWERIKKGIDTNEWECGYWDDIELIEKELKALEIIKEKRVNIDNFINRIKKDTDYKEYKRLCGLYKITIFSGKDLPQEEYDLLKEVLL